MWLFYATSCGYIPMGSDGMMKVPANIKSRRALCKLANNFRGMRAGRVYLMRSWTQAMSELGPSTFDIYVMRNGELLSHS